MITKSQAKRKQDIKTKLMAAIAMLLVSSIMMVSSTYAWFTLSTAPEVTGIQTSVGANGNLEMALLPTTATNDPTKDYGITSQVGDSVAGKTARNITWGNLVELDDASYGLDQIKLYPATINVDGGVLGASYLQTPVYGPDGRISDLDDNTVTSTYVGTTFPNNDLHGVRAVGVSAGMTPRQLAYRNAQSIASTAMATAKRDAATSLNENGNVLANVAIKKVGAEEGAAEPSYTKDEVASLLGITTDLLGTGDNNLNVIGNIEKAYIQYILAYAASNQYATTITDDQFSALKGTADAATSLDTFLTTLGGYGVTVPSEMNTPIANLTATKTAVTEANATLSTLHETMGETAAWSEISPALNKLVTIGDVKVNGYAADDAKNSMSQIVNSIITSGVNVSIETGAGVYADVADHCGNYNASVTVYNIKFGGLTLDETTANMEAKTTLPSNYLKVLADKVVAAGAPPAAGNKEMPLTEMYGYVIDLAFKTNAAESNLLLQTEAVDRIYSAQENNEQTMGGGSTMTFTSSVNSFSAENLADLMSCIRVVFFDTFTGTVFANAKLDMTEDNIDVTGGNTITADLLLYEKTADTVTYVPATTYEANTVYYTDATGSTQAGAGEVNEGNVASYFVKSVTSGTESFLSGENAVISKLTQNTAKAVSVLVYLEGEDISNADVAATVATSMSGQMNLQFASSATLVPMEYANLMEQGDAPAQGGENQG